VRPCNRKERVGVPNDTLEVRRRVFMRQIRLYYVNRALSLLKEFGPSQVCDLLHGVVDSGSRKMWTEVRRKLDNAASDIVSSANLVCCTMGALRCKTVLRKGGSGDLVIGVPAESLPVEQLTFFWTVPGVDAGVLVGNCWRPNRACRTDPCLGF
jgi:hypothetical protein